MQSSQWSTEHSAPRGVDGGAGLEDLSLLLHPASDPYSGNGVDNSVPPADGLSGPSQYLGSKHFCPHSLPPFAVQFLKQVPGWWEADITWCPVLEQGLLNIISVFSGSQCP